MEDRKRKISIVGAGAIGSTLAYALMLRGVAEEIVLVNRSPLKARVKAFDMAHCAPLLGGVKIRDGSFEDAAGSDVVAVTAGVLPSKDGNRMDVLSRNIDIYRDIIPKIAANSPEAVLLAVTNPVDLMAQAAHRFSGFPAERILGSGTLLDSLRFRYFLGKALDVDSAHLEAYVVGEHGESMVPLWSSVRILGSGLEAYLEERGFVLGETEKAEILNRTKRAGWEIRLGNEHSCYGIVFSAVTIIENLLGVSRMALPVSTLRGGIEGVFMSLPAFLGRGGVEALALPELTETEMREIRYSANTLRNHLREAERYF